MNQDWKKEAKLLDDTGVLSRRKIAEILNVPRSTVTDFLRGNELAVPGEVNVEVNPKIQEHDNSRILWISDLHAPYQHKDALQFLTDIKKQYNPTRVIIAGDEGDLSSLNFHGVDPDLPSSGDELKMLRAFIKELAVVFPVADIMESNHTSLAYRRAFKAGISKGFMKSYNDMLEVPDTWVWHNDLMIKLPNGQDCYFCHGKSSDGLKLSKNMSCNVVQGHFHSKFAIQYWSNPNNLFWSMQAGALIDDKSLAMKYNKLTLDRPIIGVGLLIDSHPILIPMPM